ncbi:MAG TPA: hypothetical protein VHY83_13800 [Solirubrobacteraceae bacterium]|jgi:hypothetical protein|nr:hypothetical protein [Solirubrobacteraceae bacterium]
MSQILPTPRISFPKQLDLLRAYAAASGAAIKPVALNDVAPIVGMTSSTISLASPFFNSVGLVTRTGGGFVPADAVLSFAQMHQWDADKAGRELKGLLRGSWFAEALMPRLEFGPLPEEEALAHIAKAADATPKARAQLQTVLEYMQVAGLIERDGELVRAADGTAEAAPRRKSPEPPTATDDPPAVRPVGGGQTPLLIQGLLQQLPTDGRWTRGQAQKWLKLAEMTFELVYDLGPDDGSFQPSDQGNPE